MFAPYINDGMGRRYFGKPGSGYRFVFRLEDALTFPAHHEAANFVNAVAEKESAPGFAVRGGVQEV